MPIKTNTAKYIVRIGKLEFIKTKKNISSKFFLMQTLFVKCHFPANRLKVFICNTSTSVCIILNRDERNVLGVLRLSRSAAAANGLKLIVDFLLYGHYLGRTVSRF